jgi:hypothetical protein
MMIKITLTRSSFFEAFGEPPLANSISGVYCSH